MQNEELIHKIEDLEKRISFSKKQETTDLSAIENKLQNFQLFREQATERIINLDTAMTNIMETELVKNGQITDLQSRVTELENNGGSAISEEQIAQIEANKQSITNQGNTISDLESAIGNHTTKINSLMTSDSAQTEDITNLSLNYSHLNNDVDSMSSSVTTLTQNYNIHEGKIQTAQSDIIDLENRVTTLENSNPSQSDLPDTYNYFNTAKFEQNQQTYGIYEHFFTCFFLTEPTSLCKIKFKANVSKISDLDYTKTLNVYLNDEVICSRQYSGKGTEDDVIEFEHYFYPQENNNRITLKSTEKNNLKKKSRLKLIDCSIEIFGRNVTVLNRDTTFRVFPAGNKYYLTKNSYENATGKIMSIGETTWNENFFDVPRIIYNVDDANASAMDKSVYTTMNHTILPKFTYDTSTSKFQIDDTNYLIVSVFCNIQNLYNLSSELAPTNFNSTNTMSLCPIYSISTPGDNDTETLHTCSVRPSSDFMLCMNKSTNLTLANMEVKLNGESLNKKWVFCTPVIYNDWVTNNTHPYYCIGLDEFGNNIFFNDREATYTIDLGKGSQTTAFGQINGNIHVYMSIANKIFKKVLTYNSSTQKYELSSSEFFCIGNEYIEGISDDYFIKKGETWNYVPPTNSTEN